MTSRSESQIVAGKSLLPPGQSRAESLLGEADFNGSWQLLVPLGRAQRKPILRTIATEEISAGLVPAGSQLTSYTRQRSSASGTPPGLPGW